jgi:hypothetical protein
MKTRPNQTRASWMIAIFLALHAVTAPVMAGGNEPGPLTSRGREAGPGTRHQDAQAPRAVDLKGHLRFQTIAFFLAGFSRAAFQSA